MTKLITRFFFIIFKLCSGNLVAQCTWMQVANDIGFAQTGSVLVGTSTDISADGSDVVVGGPGGVVNDA